METFQIESIANKTKHSFFRGVAIIPSTLIFLLTISVLASCTNNEKGALKNAYSLYDQKNFMAVLEEIDKILIEDEKNAEAFVLRGNCHLELAKNAFRMNDQFMMVTHYEDASFSFGQAIRLDENSQAAYFGKLTALANITFEEESPELIKKSKEKFPNANYTFKIFEGIEKNRTGDRLGAIADIKSSIESGRISNDEKSLALRVLASIYMNMENYEAALQTLNDAIAHNNTDDIAFAMRGEINDIQGKEEDACKDYGRAVVLGYIAKKEMLAYCE
jgi:tetratricopeptide (TPR) repeat protein